MTDLAYYFSIPLIQNMFAATALACILCGTVGAYVVVGRKVAVTGGIAHTTFGGVGFAYYVMSVYGISWMSPMAGALLFSVAAAVVMVVCRRADGVREDTVIGALWAVGMAAGVVFMCYMDRSVIVPSSYESILFGNMLLIDSGKLAVMAAVSASVLAAVMFFYRDFRIMTFDRVHAKVSGMNVTALDLLLHVLIAVTCVMVANVVGIVMIIALMTVPAAIGSIVSRGMAGTMAVGVFSALAMSFLGLLLSLAMDTPPGATVVMVLGASFAAVLAVRRLALGAAAEE
ncbi:MAG: metal ABC transporter permease [Candidatus Methanomethylophilus sp.]|nr:metal ABC transporter permease [Methanomethylophilus sp.]MCI2075345.1 metal ABC transporter permease [Methanomethylophilus sp.]MCI2092687.1 metal ABC transporter permease [Methanomethylophilus sp.]WII09848.1 metal ABC transporter permease [Methanomassiliicoccales archaeon LGM-DZ1]